MNTYTVKDPQSGRTVKLTGDSPPTEQELNQIFAKLNASQDAPSMQSFMSDPAKRPLADLAQSAAGNPMFTQAATQDPDATAHGVGPAPGFTGLGAMAGSAINPLVGAAGAGVGAIAERMSDLATGRVAPSDAGQGKWFAGREALNPMAQTAMAGLPDTKQVHDVVQRGVQGMARRALGFSKPMLKRWGFGVKEANAVGQEMLDNGVIGPFASSETRLARAKALQREASQTIGETLDKAGTGILNPAEAASAVESQLAPPYGPHVERGFKPGPDGRPIFTEETVGAGAYDKTRSILDDMKETIQAPGKNKAISFQEAQNIKSKLGEQANFLKETAPEKGEMYRRGYGIMRDYIDKGLEHVTQTGRITPEDYVNFVSAKRTYGAASRAIEGLTDRAAAEATNNMISLRGAMIGAASVASGHVTPALETLGLFEWARRGGGALGAWTVNQLNNSPLAQNVRRALLSRFIDKMQIGKEGQ